MLRAAETQSHKLCMSDGHSQCKLGKEKGKKAGPSGPTLARDIGDHDCMVLDKRQCAQLREWPSRNPILSPCP